MISLERFVLRLAVDNRFARPQTVPHDFRDEQTSTADLVHEPLADDVAECLRKTLAQLLFLLTRLNIPRIRLIVCPALIVCSVLKTMWPVSDAVIAISSVSGSRISPTRMAFGA